MMDMLIAIDIVFFGIFLVIYILCIYGIYDHTPPKGCPTISFNLFRNLYNMNPYRWKLSDNYVEYRIPKDGIYETIFFKNYFEYRKYSRWLKKRDKEKQEKRINNLTMKLAKYWEEDIKKAQEENWKRMKEMMEKNEKEGKKYEIEKL